MSQRQFIFRLPMRIQSSKKKKTAINLNIYRNLHFRSLSAQKNNFHKMMESLLRELPTLGRIILHYDICPRTKVRLDVMNVGSIVDKYFSDSLVELGKIEDDNYDFINHVSFGFGGLAEEEHVLVTITEIEPRKENPMRILLDESEIQTALEAFVETLGLTGVTGVQLDTNDAGEITAEVLMGEATAEKPKTTRTPTKNRGGRPAGSKNKVTKEDNDDVATTDEDSDAVDSSGASESAKEEAEDSTDQTSKSPAKPEGGKSKNLFGESHETSSEGDPDEEEEGGDQSTGTPVKKSSIFDT